MITAYHSNTHLSEEMCNDIDTYLTENKFTKDGECGQDSIEFRINNIHKKEIIFTINSDDEFSWIYRTDEVMPGGKLPEKDKQVIRNLCEKTNSKPMGEILNSKVVKSFL
jgi:hypothetical protein